MKKLSINFFNIVLSKNQISVPYLDFKDAGQIKNLRATIPNAIFFRSREKVLFWGADSLSASGFQKVDQDNWEDGNLLSNILAHSLLKQFYQSATNIEIYKRTHSNTYKITFFDKDISNNKYRGLELYKTFHLHFTPFQTSSSLFTGFTISTSVTTRISWRLEDFKAAGIRYDDLRYDQETREIFATTVAKYRLANHFNYASQLKHELDRQNSLQDEFREINTFVETYFKNSPDGFILPDALQINAINETVHDSSTSQKDFTILTLPRPETYFYNGAYPPSKTSFHKRRKISYNKPFTYDEFENRPINISVIYPQYLYQDVRNFFKHIQKELIETFKLKKESFNYTTYEIEDFSLRSYQVKLSSIRNADLVVVVVDEAHEALPPDVSPYYFCKAEFIRRGINTQEVQIQQIRQFLSDKTQNRPNYTDQVGSESIV